MDDGFAKGILIDDKGLDGELVEELDARFNPVSFRNSNNSVYYNEAYSEAERERRLASFSVFVHSSSQGSDSLERAVDASYGEGGGDGPPSSAANLHKGLSKNRKSFRTSHSSRKFPGRRQIRYQNAIKSAYYFVPMLGWRAHDMRKVCS